MRLEDMAYSDMKINFMFFMNGGANGDVFRLFFPAFYARICLGEPIGRVYNSIVLPKELFPKRPSLYCKSQEDLMNSVTGRSPEYGSGNSDVYEMGAEPLSWNDILPLAAAAIAQNRQLWKGWIRYAGDMADKKAAAGRGKEEKFILL